MSPSAEKPEQEYTECNSNSPRTKEGREERSLRRDRAQRRHWELLFVLFFGCSSHSALDTQSREPPAPTELLLLQLKGPEMFVEQTHLR